MYERNDLKMNRSPEREVANLGNAGYDYVRSETSPTDNPSRLHKPHRATASENNLPVATGSC